MVSNVQQILLFPVVCLLSISLENKHMTILLFYNQFVYIKVESETLIPISQR